MSDFLLKEGMSLFQVTLGGPDYYVVAAAEEDAIGLAIGYELRASGKAFLEDIMPADVSAQHVPLDRARVLSYQTDDGRAISMLEAFRLTAGPTVIACTEF